MTNAFTFLLTIYLSATLVFHKQVRRDKANMFHDKDFLPNFHADLSLE